MVTLALTDSVELVQGVLTIDVLITDFVITDEVTVAGIDVVVPLIVHGVVGLAVTQEHRALALFRTSTALDPGQAARTQGAAEAWIEL